MKPYAHFLFALLCGHAHAEPCSVNTEPMLEMELVHFDQSQEGWRSFGEHGCPNEAIKVLSEYIQKNGSVYNLEFHLAQLCLKVGQYERARKALLAAYRKEMPPDNPLKWNEFVDAYIAYVDNDRKKLEVAEQAIAAGTAFWGNKANLQVVQALLQNIGKPYAEIFKLGH